LRRDGKPILDSLSKVYLAAEKKGNVLDVLLEGQPVVNAILRAAPKPANILLNEKEIGLPYDEGTKSVRISLQR
jgi:oligo-alginate lyase